MKKRVCFGVFSIGALFGQSAFAHPGHVTEIVTSSSGWHYILQPTHGGAVLIAALAGLSLWITTRIRVARELQALRAEKVASPRR